jgi:V/A-type H+/Na+-transporting ATPase subunit K
VQVNKITRSAGLPVRRGQTRNRSEDMKKSSNGLFVGVLMAALLLASAGLSAEMGSPRSATETGDVSRTIGLGVAAAFAIAFSIIGAGYAVGKIGSAALGAAVEKPELLMRSLLFVALAEGLAVLGFAIAMMLIQKI